MILRLAAALDVPLRRQNALLLAAGYAPELPGDFDAIADPFSGHGERLVSGRLVKHRLLSHEEKCVVARGAHAWALVPPPCFSGFGTGSSGYFL